jgi:hypothetical protein
MKPQMNQNNDRFGTQEPQKIKRLLISCVPDSQLILLGHRVFLGGLCGFILIPLFS